MLSSCVGIFALVQYVLVVSTTLDCFEQDWFIV
jgi:hypothetical protein